MDHKRVPFSLEFQEWYGFIPIIFFREYHIIDVLLLETKKLLQKQGSWLCLNFKVTTDINCKLQFQILQFLNERKIKNKKGAFANYINCLLLIFFDIRLKVIKDKYPPSSTVSENTWFFGNEANKFAMD